MSGADPPKPGMPTWAKVLLAIGGVCLLCCGGAVWLAWGTIREVADFAALPPAEQQAAMRRVVEAAVADQTAVASAFLSDLDAGRTAEAWARTAPGLRSVTDEPGLVKLQSKVTAVMGARGQCTLQNAFSRTNFVGGASVETCDLTYAATYEKGPATITFRLERGAAGWLVQLYRVDSPRFLDAIPESAPAESPK